MVEVFKTNVSAQNEAERLIHEIHRQFNNYEANFDLQDCDHVLRVECTGGSIESGELIGLVRAYGFDAEVLNDYPEGIDDWPKANDMEGKNY